VSKRTSERNARTYAEIVANSDLSDALASFFVQSSGYVSALGSETSNVSLLTTRQVMSPALPIHIHSRKKKRGRMAKIVERVQGLFGDRKGIRAISLDQATPTRLTSDPPVTVQLSEEQSERVRELEEHGPAAR